MPVGFGLAGSDTQPRVKRRVEQRGVYTESISLVLVGLRQGDLGKDVFSTPPNSTEPLEGRPISKPCWARRS